MNTLRTGPLGVAAALLLLPFDARAVTDTWDGGGGNDLISLGANWVDNTAPVTDLANTDLIFAGLIRLTPALNASFDTKSITFNNTAGAFAVSGQTFVIGTGGIVNNDTQTMTFNNVARFSGVATSTINAAAGGLTFTNTVALATGTLTVTGGSPTNFLNFSGNSALEKTGVGTMTWTPNLPTSFDVTVSSGTLTLGADGSADVFNSGASIAVNGTSTVNINESLTLDGAQLTRATGGILNLAAGKTLTVQNGGDAVITGTFTNNTASTIALAGAGSTFSTTGTLLLHGGSTFNVSAGGGLTSGAQMNIGTSGNGTVSVDGAGSSLSGTNVLIGANTSAGSLAFTNDSQGTFTTISFVPSSVGGAIGTLSIASGADVSATSLSLAVISGANTGTATVTGAGSTLTVSGAGAATIGSTGGNSGTLNVNNSGTFNSGTGATVVRKTGTISVLGGNLLANGNVTVDGGRITVDSAGDFRVVPGTVFTVQDGATVNVGDFFSTNGSTFSATGAGSIVSFTGGVGGGLFSVNNGSNATISNGATLEATALGISNGAANGSLTIDGAGTQLIAASVTVTSGGAGSLTFRNGSTGTLAQISVDEASSNSGATGTVNIESGAAVTINGGGAALSISRRTGTHSGTLTIDGAGSALTLSGTGTTIIGSASGSSGTLKVQNSGTHHSGTSLTTVHPTGAIAITGGTYISNGDLTLEGGQLTRDATGVFSLAAGKTLTVQNGGDAIFTGSFNPGSNTSITVNGAGSTLSTTSFFNVQTGSSLLVSAGGAISPLTASIGTIGGNGTVTIDGAGSSFSSSLVTVGFNGFTGTLTFSNGSTGTINTLGVDRTSTGGTVGIVNIQSGANVSVGTLNLADTGGAGANSGTVTVSGAGSVLTITSTTIGTNGNGSTGTLTVGSGARLDVGSFVTLNALGTLNVNAGATLTGGANFNGTGQVNIAGAFRPGAVSGAGQTRSVNFAQDMTFHPTSKIVMEIGGGEAGTHYDQIFFNGPGNTQVSWNGTLDVVLINGFIPQAGQGFQLFDFDAQRDAGAFSAINLPALPAGLFWRTDQLYRFGFIFTSATPSTFAEFQAAFSVGAFTADDDLDGVPNGIEFVLGTDPKVPGGAPTTAFAPVDSPPNRIVGIIFAIPLEPPSEAHYRVFGINDVFSTGTLLASRDGIAPWVTFGSATVSEGAVVNGRVTITVTETIPSATTSRFHRLEAVAP